GFDQLLRIRNLQQHDFACSKGPRFQLAHPSGGVHAQNVFIASRIGLKKILLACQTFAQKQFVNEAEFLRKENVGAEVQVVAVVVDEFEWEWSHHLAELL